MDRINIPAENPSFIRSVTFTPRIITAYLIRALIQKFSTLDNIRDPALKKGYYLYSPVTQSPQNAATGMIICTPYSYQPLRTQKRPAIIVGRESTALGPRLSMGDQYQVPTNLIGNGHNPNETATLGQNQQLLQFEGSHNIACVHTEGEACEVLSFEVFDWLAGFQSIIRRELGLHMFRLGEMGAPQKLNDNYSENWVVQFKVGYTYQKGAILVMESPLLKAISLELDID